MVEEMWRREGEKERKQKLDKEEEEDEGSEIRE